MTEPDTSPPPPDDRARVAALLGREPQGRFEVVVRTAEGDPVVLRNAALLDDGTPMPTRYWLVGAVESRRVGQLEAAGGVAAAEAAIDPAEIAEAHHRYAAERDAEIPADHVGPRPSGGVGGTRVGVKCLHAHWAWHLAGGNDPVGRWIAAQFDVDPAGTIDIADHQLAVHLAGGVTAIVPWGPANLTERWLNDHDPPLPEALTNALGTIDDHLDDVERDHPGFASWSDVVVRGPAATAFARLEAGLDQPPDPATIDRVAAEEVFRLVATERRVDRSHNPGLPSEAVGTIVATAVIVVALVRRLDLAEITVRSTPATAATPIAPSGGGRR